MQKYQTYIDGKYVDPASGKWFDSYNPYTGEPWAQIAQGTAEDADRAVREYLQVKSVWINTGAVTGNPFVMR
ncbi:MAG: aldehyde dehydrogenase family protein [Betaproteobacteria bacterium]|nr:aldehyde dehydrogenase family protein [Betaproteobacteria bacterium]